MSQDIVEKTALLPPGSIEQWNRIRARLRATVGHDVFEGFFRSLKLEQIFEGIVVMSVMTDSTRRTLERSYKEPIVNCAQQEFPAAREVRIVERKMGRPYQPLVAPQKSQVSEPSSQEGDEKTLENTPAPQKRTTIYPEAVIEACCIYYGIKRVVLLYGGRRRELVQPRQRCAYLCKNLTRQSFEDIGEKLNQHHTTVIHSVQKVEQEMKNDPELVEELTLLTRFLEYGDVPLVRKVPKPVAPKVERVPGASPTSRMRYAGFDVNTK